MGVPQFDGTLETSLVRLEAYLAEVLDPESKAAAWPDGADRMPVEHAPRADDSCDLVLGDLRLVVEAVTDLGNQVADCAAHLGPLELELVLEQALELADLVSERAARLGARAARASVGRGCGRCRERLTP